MNYHHKDTKARRDGDRSPLTGRDPTLHYDWNAWDEMSAAYYNSIYSGFYYFDASGRSLAKARLGLSDWSITVGENFWLGLNKIAESGYVGGDPSVTVLRPDSESSGDPTVNGWYDLSGGSDTLEYTTDDDRGKVLHTEGASYFFSYGAFIIGDDPTNPLNPKYDDNGFQTTNPAVGLWFRNASYTNNSLELIFLVEVDDGTTTSMIQMEFITGDGTDGISTSGGRDYYRYYIGSAWNDNTWHYFEEDLSARIHELNSGVDLSKVDAFAMVGYLIDAYVDDVQFAETVLDKSYQVVPGGLNYLAAQSGSTGGISQDPWARWYYVTNDLATPLVTTDANGSEISVAEPDAFGNYRYVSGTRPDTLGLDGKFFDADAGSHYFGLRWEDGERGRWASNQGSHSDGPNLYHFGFNSVMNGYDTMRSRWTWRIPFITSALPPFIGIPPGG